MFSCFPIRWVTRKWKVTDDLTVESNALGIPHLLNETDHYKGYVLPKGALVVPNAWYAFAFIISYYVPSHVLSGRCSTTQEFTWTRIVLTQTAFWQLKVVFRRWIPARSVYLDLGGGASIHEGSRMIAESFSHFSKCPGQHLAELTTWLGVACILAGFDISPALDEHGKAIDVRYALSGNIHLVT
jgi:hypothetical protein